MGICQNKDVGKATKEKSENIRRNIMMSMLTQEEIKVRKKDGSIKEGYQVAFTATTIFVSNISADIQEGDVVIRKLPNGNEDLHYITKVNYYSSKTGFPEHYQLKFTKAPPEQKMEKKVQNINFHGTPNVQIGDHNTQNIINVFNDLIQKIESSSASEAEKKAAKSLLGEFLKHPLVISILGSVAGAAIGLL
jgi:hypothetical protein